MNYYPFHIGDYLSATRHLSWEEDAAYRRLLDTYYTTEKPLPLDLRAVYRLVVATTDSQREAVRVVLEEFFERTDIGWVNGRADTEIATMREKQQKQRDKANAMWEKRRAMSGNASGISTAEPQHTKNDATASKLDTDAMPPTPTPTPTPTPKKEYTHFRASEFLEKNGAEKKLVLDWLKVRKEKRLANTETAFKGFLKEVTASGGSINDVLTLCCQKSWGGFKAEWLSKEGICLDAKKENHPKTARGCIWLSDPRCSNCDETKPRCDNFRLSE